jgi:hypothetical protein
MKTNKLTLSIVISFIVGVFVMYSCNSSVDKPKEEPIVESYDCELKVIATGEKNPLSESSEVWILNINSNLEQVDSLFKSAMIDSNWVKSGERVVAVKWPASIRYKVKASELLTLRLYKHTWSGEAEVYLNDKLVEKLDLYSTDSVKNYIDIAIDPSKY